MRSPLGKPTWISSFFDHDTPFLQENGSLISYWGRTETQLSYDGHTGWDYALAPPDQVLAAAAGNVIFAGNSDDGCGIARAVILDHRNGYRSLYWHLDSIAVEAGQQVETGQELGIAGATGCVTGPHLHFQVQYLGRDVDPYGWCGGATPDPWAAAGAGQVSVWLWADRPSPCAPRPANAILVDDHDSGFFLSGTWQETPLGYGGGAHFIPSVRGDPVGSFDLQPLALPDVAVWRPKLPAPGSYRVRAYIPYILNGLNDARDTIYIVRHSQGETEVRIDGLIFANEWADLGTYHFDPGQTPQVTVSDRTADLGASIWADAIVWEPVP
jgi:murein DD-endopeptidase MepM/ murein hydrolase activator NlpD